MMKKNVIIRSGSLRMGGLERVLIEVLQNIDKKKYNLTLVIDDDCGEDNIFEKDIPKEIPYYFLKSQKLIEKTNYYKLRRKNILYKLMYNIYMNIETYIKSKNIKKLIEKLGKIDVFIDYDAGATKYIENIEADKKVVWIHNSIPNLKKSESKIKRFGKRLEKYDRIVAICDEMKEELKDIYPNLKDKIIRIYNPFNFSRVLNLKDDMSELTEKDKELFNILFHMFKANKPHSDIAKLDTKCIAMTVCLNNTQDYNGKIISDDYILIERKNFIHNTKLYEETVYNLEHLEEYGTRCHN